MDVIIKNIISGKHSDNFRKFYVSVCKLSWDVLYLVARCLYVKGTKDQDFVFKKLNIKLGDKK